MTVAFLAPALDEQAIERILRWTRRAGPAIFVAVVRFESLEQGQANSDGPEQGAWWDKTGSTFDGEVTFPDCPDLDTFGAGGPTTPVSSRS